jgi:hypothetical protein
MATLRSDVIIPEIFTPYLIEATTVRNSFLTSGVVTALDALNATEGGDQINIPNWKADLAGDAERLTDTGSLTPGKITADKQVGVILHRGRAWESRDLARLAAGSDPMGAIGAKVADYIANQQQKDMIATLEGVFGALGSSNAGAAFAALSVDATGSGETNLGPRQIAAAEALLLEDAERLGAIVMHPLVYADLKERKAIDFVTATDARVTASTAAAAHHRPQRLRWLGRRGLHQLHDRPLLHGDARDPQQGRSCDGQQPQQEVRLLRHGNRRGGHRPTSRPPL